MIKKCGECGEDFKVKDSHAKLRVNCSRKCMAKSYAEKLKGEANPNYKNAGRRECEFCHGVYRDYYRLSARRFCSWKCYQASGAAAENSKKNGGAFRRGVVGGQGRHGKVDQNQKTIVEGLRKAGVGVLITSDLGNGFPDLVLGMDGLNHLVEVKNPKTYYGRKGLNPNQQAFAEWWSAPVYVVTTLEEALNVVDPQKNPVINEILNQTR